MFLNQDFKKLRDECVRKGKLFEDPLFEPSDRILRKSDKYKWLRPKEINRDAKFYVEGFSRFDVSQGDIGDCWLLAAIASLTQDPKLFFNVVHEDNSLDENYAGIFHFRFWLYGEWIDIVIDDRLPTNPYTKKLAFIRSTENNEFWSALLEKAYAKFYGSYEKLRGGNTCEAQEDFTGGIAEVYHLKNPPSNIYTIVLKAFEKNCLLGCGIDSDEKSREEVTLQGLVKGHAYSITKVQMVNIQTLRKSGMIELLRVRNPWGGDVEWTGAFSDKSREWQLVTESEKLDLNFDHDGEFWMSFRDFLKYFDTLEICNVLQNYVLCDEEEQSETWFLKEVHGQWIANENSGGCRNYIETFHLNPQYILELSKSSHDVDGKCSVLIALMQKNRRRLGLQHLAIGFVIYDITYCESSTIFNKSFFLHAVPIARSNSYVNLRGNARKFKFPPGKYLIIPSTYEPYKVADYFLRVVAEGPCELSKALK